jgi:hypothetical protein
LIDVKNIGFILPISDGFTGVNYDSFNIREFKPLKVGLQISFGFYTEIS